MWSVPELVCVYQQVNGLFTDTVNVSHHLSTQNLPKGSINLHTHIHTITLHEEWRKGPAGFSPHSSQTSRDTVLWTFCCGHHIHSYANLRLCTTHFEGSEVNSDKRFVGKRGAGQRSYIPPSLGNGSPVNLFKSLVNFGPGWLLSWALKDRKSCMQIKHDWSEGTVHLSLSLSALLHFIRP